MNNTIDSNDEKIPPLLQLVRTDYYIDSDDDDYDNDSDESDLDDSISLIPIIIVFTLD